MVEGERERHRPSVTIPVLRGRLTGGGAGVDGRRIVVAGLALLVAHNAVVAVVHSEAIMLLVNVAFAAVMTSWAYRRGLHRNEVVGRLRWRSAVVGAALTAGVAVAILAAVQVGLLPPHGETVALAPGELWFRLLIGIPIGTALCEELIFRGVLLAAWDRVATRPVSTAATSAMFGLWHVAAEAQRLGGVSLAVLTGVAATTAVSAFVLCPLRRLTGDLVAPTVLHAAVNAGIFASLALPSS